MNRLRLAAALVGSTALAITFTSQLPAGAATAKLGASCTKSQSGKVSGTLVCAKSGSSYKWVKRPTTTKKSSSSASTATAPAATPQSPSQVDLVNIAFGAPTGTATKIDVACTGTFAAGGNEAKTASFGPAGGSSQTSFSLVEPGTSNPTGSSCTATATVSGATPSALQLLVNGRTQAGPVAAATLGAPAFTAPGPFVVTAIVIFGGGSAPGPATTAPPTATTQPGLVAGATTTTLAAGTTTPPPASGKPEVRNVFLGTVPTTLTGVDIKVTCTPAPGSNTFQVQSTRLGVQPTSAALALVLAAPSGGSSGTQCQVEAGLVGTVDASQVTARVLLNGQPVSGPTSGTFINSPSFAASQPFTATAEFSFPGATTATTAPSSGTLTGTQVTVLNGTGTTMPGVVTTTTLVGNPGTTTGTTSSISVVPAGTVPAGVNGYRVELSCTNVVAGGVVQPTYTFTSTFGVSATSFPYSFTPTAASQCSVNVSTLGTVTNLGAVTVSVGGVPRGSGTAGAASVAAFAQPTPIQLTVNIQY